MLFPPFAIGRYPRYSQSYSFDTAISLGATCEAVLTIICLLSVPVTLFSERSDSQWDSCEAGLLDTNTLAVVHVTLCEGVSRCH